MAIIDKKTGKATWYEGDHGEQRDPFRDWIRERCPAGKEGFVCEDLDIVINCFGKMIGRNHSGDGRIKLIEKKINRNMKYPQQRTFELLDRLLRMADPKGKFYRGLYTVKFPLIQKVEDFNIATFEVKKHPNGPIKSMDAEEFIAFLQDKDFQEKIFQKGPEGSKVEIQQEYV